METTVEDSHSINDTEYHSDEDVPECRVCGGEAEPDRRLFAPCKCSGTIRFTHGDCLEQWLKHSGKKKCELCSYKYEFRPLYEPNAPDVLPYSELTTAALSVLCLKWIPFILRMIIVVILWAGVVPWCTSWLYRMWLLRASAMVNVNFRDRFEFEKIKEDAFAGMVIVFLVVFSFLSLLSFADFLRFNADQIDEEEDQRNEVQHRHPLRQQNLHNRVPRRPRLALRIEELQNQDNDNVQFNDEANEQPAAERDPVVFPEPNHENEADIEEVDPLQPILRNRRVNGQGHIPQQPQPQAQPQPAPRRRRENPVNADDWNDDFEHMEINIAIDELLGIRGDFFVLFRNVAWLLAFNGAYLGLFAFLPYTLGATIISSGQQIFNAMPYLSQLLMESLTTVTQAADTTLPIYVWKEVLQSINNATVRGDCLQLEDVCTIIMGYLSIGLTIILWRLMVTTASSYIHRPLVSGLLWGLRCLSAVVKVSSLLLLKMIILPIVLGFGTGIAALPLFHVTFREHISYWLTNMVGGILFHWVLGITFMLFVTLAVLQLREVMHPDILAGVIRPQEAHPDLLKTLLTEKCTKHARRMILSILIYSGLLISLVYIPSKLANLTSLSANFLPLSFRLQYFCPELQVPLELFVVHLVVLQTLENAKNEIGRLQHVALVYGCKYLGLTKTLLPCVEATWLQREISYSNSTTGSVPTVILAPPPIHFHPPVRQPPHRLRIQGKRYLPWPEENETGQGLNRFRQNSDDSDHQAMEYRLLPREVKPKFRSLRLLGLGLYCWMLCVMVVVVMVMGTFILGRIVSAPFERLLGIYHDPLALAVGVEMVATIINGLNGVSALCKPLSLVRPSLVRRGYNVYHWTIQNAVLSFLGWCFVCPFLIGSIISKSFPSMQMNIGEVTLTGFFVLHVVAQLICYRRKSRRRAQRRRRARNRRDNNNNRNEVDFDQDILLELDDLNDEFEDERIVDNPLLFEIGEPEDNEDNDGEADILQEEQNENLQLNEEEVANNEENDDNEHKPALGFIGSLRQSYRQLLFNVYVHDSDLILSQHGFISDKCFDMAFFLTNVLRPLITILAGLFLTSLILSNVLFFGVSVFTSRFTEVLESTSFTIAMLICNVTVSIILSHNHVIQWLKDVREALRNERYLVGRELQDRVE